MSHMRFILNQRDNLGCPTLWIKCRKTCQISPEVQNEKFLQKMPGISPKAIVVDGRGHLMGR